MNEATRKRMCLFIPADAFVEGEGWRVSIVTEGEPGHCPTGTWPYKAGPGETAPWFWGKTEDGYWSYEKVCEFADKQNAERFGYTKEDIFAIVTSSMFGRRRVRNRRAS